VARWSVTSGVAGEVETTGDARALHPEVEVTLLRVAQEALANVAKHAGASRAGVTLSYMEDVVSLDVRDDGAGFLPPSRSAAPTASNGNQAGGGFGLIAMRQRVDRLAGQLEIESEPGTGTAVSASLPAIPLGESN
jgi:signal transduction histidine kinase